MTFSAGIVAYGIVDSNIPAATGGGLVGLAAATMMALAKVRAWAVDTSAERRKLDDALQAANDERTRYIALGVAQREEHKRRLRDLEGDRARLRADHEAARVTLQDRYEDQRETLIVESMETGVRLYLAGLLTAPQQVAGDIVPFRLRQRGEAPAVHPADATQAAPAARDREVGRP
ncbi:hypothetical protein [Streptomyces vinaceus]|uniref:hypothetical protein n=1 Tax=Streptomyces vinaceus TaxID=1960 RepID=UPI0036C28A6E